MVEKNDEHDKDDGPVMNAFDLINKCGGMALNRMFQTSEEHETRKYTQFTSTLPVADIVEKVKSVLNALKSEVMVVNTSKVKATLQTPPWRFMS
jgi:hypothetical protein